jgi:hypothetical protein
MVNGRRIPRHLPPANGDSAELLTKADIFQLAGQAVRNKIQAAAARKRLFKKSHEAAHLRHANPAGRY